MRYNSLSPWGCWFRSRPGRYGKWAQTSSHVAVNVQCFVTSVRFPVVHSDEMKTLLAFANGVSSGTRALDFLPLTWIPFKSRWAVKWGTQSSALPWLWAPRSLKPLISPFACNDKYQSLRVSQMLLESFFALLFLFRSGLAKAISQLLGLLPLGLHLSRPTVALSGPEGKTSSDLLTSALLLQQMERIPTLSFRVVCV